MTGTTQTLHAAALLAGNAGLLITGRAGSGKSSLARHIVREWTDREQFACLVGDDRIVLNAHHGRLIARSHPAIAGLAEIRGIGIVQMPAEPAACITLVIDLVEGPIERMPDRADMHVILCGIVCPRLCIQANMSPDFAESLVRTRLAARDFRS